jgi:nitrile hydratase accessory protein
LTELDIDGPAAPPRTNGELAFEHPWQSRLFATTMALCEAGTITYAEFRDRLIDEVGEHPDQYWCSWQDALEGVLAEHSLCDLADLAERARRFAEHTR